MKAWRLAMWLAGASVTVAAPVFAAPGDAVAPSGAERHRLSEQELIQRLHFNNQQEIALGQLAAERAQTPSVRKLGERMVREYRRLDEQLLRLAQRRGVSLDVEHLAGTGGSGQQAPERARLTELSGAEFEREFLATALRDSSIIRENAMQDARPAQLTALQVDLLKTNQRLRDWAQGALARNLGVISAPMVPLAQDNG
jgi:predicted outer membrane protein